jgi:Tol biopolymer transport system component
LIRFDRKSKQFQPFLGGISANLLSFQRGTRTVAYVAYPDHAIWKSNMDGTGRLQLSDGSLPAEHLSISPDGSQGQVAFMAPSPESNVRRAYVISSRGEGAKLLLPKSSGPETDPSWSPDGRRIAFATNTIDDKNRPSDIRIFDVPTQQVSTVPDSAGKFGPRWSPNGQYLLAPSLDLGNLYIFDFKTSQWTQIYEGISAYASWSHDGRFIYTFRYAGEPAILRIQAKGGLPELVTDVKGIRYTGTFGVWFGLDPTDAPLLLRDEGTSDVYALSLQRY